MTGSVFLGPPPEAEALPGSAPGRADLVRALVLGGREALEAAAERHGFGLQSPCGTAKEERPEGKTQQQTRKPTPPPPPTDLAKQRPEPALYWKPVGRDALEGQLETSPAEDAYRQLQLSEEHLQPAPDGVVPEPDPIVAWPRLWRALEDRLKSPRPRQAIDVEALVRRWSRGETVRRIPRRVGLAHARLVVFLDRRESLKPFWQDQVTVTRKLAKHLGRDSMRLVSQSLLFKGPLSLKEDERLLILSDLGLYGGPEAPRPWLRLGHQLRRSARPSPVALVPCPRNRWKGAFPKVFSVVDWSSPDRVGSSHTTTPAEAELAVEKVLRLASVGLRLETGLVRQLRRLVPEADLASEVDLWGHPSVVAAQAIGLVIDEDRARVLRQEMATLPASLQVRVISLLALWHKNLAPETWAAEVAGLLGLGVSPKLIGEAEIAQSSELIGRIANLIEAGGSSLAKDADFWLDRLIFWSSRGLWRHKKYRPSLSRAIAARQEREPERPLPSGLTSEMLAGSSSSLPSRRYVIWQEGQYWEARLPQEKGYGSPLAEIEARRPRLHCDSGDPLPEEVNLAEGGARWQVPNSSASLFLVSDVETLELEPVTKPQWAQWAGRDRFGLWAAFEFKGVRQKLRWIPPGRFWMGSPREEIGRFEREGPRRRVTLSDGFWLGETPCTQALWEAVTGSNPSLFISPERPVEQVSWDDCQSFLAELNARVAFLDAELPSEAQWEYACRAGTTGATWKGELGSDEEASKSILDEIAWFAGNSGRKQEAEGLEGLEGPLVRPETLKSREIGNSQAVGKKEPNPWGLHDMLGNVHEWCSDFYGRYEETPAVDPEGSGKGSMRVFRGGSWNSHAQHVRAASRLGDGPGARDSDLGFRLVRGPGRGALSSSRGSAAARGGTTSHRRGPRPMQPRTSWAKTSGEDPFGFWAAIEVAGIDLRFRWVEPGSFWMGSPKTEVGRWKDEGPRHQVRLTRGFWLGETPCTQALWERAVGSNPSRFRSPTRPVESVSWNDCQDFLTQLEELDPGPRFRLPTEAEWEYACRAGTESALWTGDLEILGERNAPSLDEIAWYGGNSGVGFELGESVDSSNWKDKQYPHERAGTRQVGEKTPNRWGLYDMLGNVHEWCSDWFGSYSSGSVADPVGPAEGSERVIRGGSWISRAQSVRAAFRVGFVPGARIHNLGFRLVRGPGGGAEER